MSNVEVLVRLLVAAFLGGLVGLEREKHGRAAGFRTHILVCVGACLVMALSLFLFDQYHSDPARIAGHVISGIGFLGAGTILRFRVSVKGLTTAASLWAVSAIGLAVGAGFYFGSLVTTGVVLIALFWLTKLVDKVIPHRDWYKTVEIEMKGAFESLKAIREILAAYHTEIKDLSVTKVEGGGATLTIEIKLLSPRDEEPILKELVALEGVKRAVWKEV